MMYQPTRFTGSAFVARASRGSTPHIQHGDIPAQRYSDLTDRDLAERLASEDAAVEAGASPFERLTCPMHRRWLHRCISSPQHVIPVTGHRWCRECQSPATVTVDELDGDVAVACPRCHRVPDGIATRQIVSACRASLSAERHVRDSTANYRVAA
jgi:hypothetical protein